MFAIGDCIDLAIPKIAYLAGQMGEVIDKNIAASAAGKPLKDLVPPVQPVSLVPVGSKGGVSALPMGFVMGDFVTRNAKSSDLFCTKFWGGLNAGKPPAVP